MRSNLQESQVTGPSRPLESMLCPVPGAKTVALIAVMAISVGLAPAGVTPAPFQAVAFEPNVGQTDGRAEFIARAPNASLWLTREGVVMSLLEKGRTRRAFRKLRFVAAPPNPRLSHPGKPAEMPAANSVLRSLLCKSTGAVQSLRRYGWTGSPWGGLRTAFPPA